MSALLLEQLGWRGTCFAYAALHLGLILPLYGAVLPRNEAHARPSAPAQDATSDLPTGITPARQWLLYCLMATAFSVGWGISSVLSVHLLAMLQARGLELAAAVALAP